MRLSYDTRVKSLNPHELAHRWGNDILTSTNMIPGSKGLNPHELAHMWVKDLGTRPNMSIKVG